MDPLSLFLRKLRELVNTDIETRSRNLVAGNGIDKFEKYREEVGTVRGLHLAMQYCEQVHEMLMRPEDEQPNPQRALPARVIERRSKMNPNWEP